MISGTLFQYTIHDKEYSLCDICEFNGYPNEKIVFVIHGFRHEHEDGFAIKFAEYDFPAHNRKTHSHKYNEQLIKNLVNQSLAGMDTSV